VAIDATHHPARRKKARAVGHIPSVGSPEKARGDAGCRIYLTIRLAGTKARGITPIAPVLHIAEIVEMSRLNIWLARKKREHNAATGKLSQQAGSRRKDAN
jgi:hypothetical protein